MPGLETMKLESRGLPDAPPAPIVDLGARMLEGPDRFFERMALHSRDLLPERSSGSSPGVVRRLGGFTVEPRTESVFTTFAESWKARNLEYFASFGEAEAYTPGFEAQVEDIRMKDLGRDQSKIAWDALRDAYFGRYDFAPDRMLRYDAWRFETWRGIDYLLLPPLMAAYLYFRGMDATFTFTGSRLKISIDPLSSLILDEDPGPELSAVWSPFERLPGGVIAQATLRSGDLDLDFIGVGTSLSEVRKVLSLQLEP